MYIEFHRNPKRLGCVDEWTATLGVPGSRPGIGKTVADATDSLVRANLAAFGVTSRRVVDPLSDPEDAMWKAQTLGE